MKRSLFFLFLVLSLAACKPDEDTNTPMVPSTEIPGYEGYTLVWNEEFSGTAINLLNWTYELGDGTDYGLSSGWGNEELQLYTNDPNNAFVEKDAEDISALVIVAQEESPANYTSAKLTTQGLQSFRYGRIEARMILPTATGMWPAFWMLGTNITQVDWPGCGEIDIMELVGKEADVIHGSVHYTNADNKRNSITESDQLPSGDFSEAYHDFRVDWDAETMVFSLDGTPYHSLTIADDMKEFQRSFYLILNLAVGGSWPGSPDGTTTFPQKMYVDYIRAYSKDDYTAPAEPALDINEETIGTFIPPSLAEHAFSSTLGQFPGIGLQSYGAGGEPEITGTDMAVEGDSAILFSYPGGNWGGGWFEMETPMDLSAFASGNLVFSIRYPADLADAEVKLEAVTNSADVFLANYTPLAIANDYVQYTIPLADFTDLDFGTIKIPFAFWNPVDSNGEYPALEVFIDDIYWVE